MILFEEYRLLNEDFNSPYPWKWQTQSGRTWLATGKVATGKLQVFFLSALTDGDWELTFRVNGTFQPTHGGDAYRIFSTVFDILKAFIQRNNPHSIFFSADKFEGDSRTKLYSVFVKKFADSIGYDYKITPGPHYGFHTIYTLTRKT